METTYTERDMRKSLVLKSLPLLTAAAAVLLSLFAAKPARALEVTKYLKNARAGSWTVTADSVGERYLTVVSTVGSGDDAVITVQMASLLHHNGSWNSTLVLLSGKTIADSGFDMEKEGVEKGRVDVGGKSIPVNILTFEDGDYTIKIFASPALPVSGVARYEVHQGGALVQSYAITGYGSSRPGKLPPPESSTQTIDMR